MFLWWCYWVSLQSVLHFFLHPPPPRSSRLKKKKFRRSGICLQHELKSPKNTRLHNRLTTKKFILTKKLKILKFLLKLEKEELRFLRCFEIFEKFFYDLDQ